MVMTAIGEDSNQCVHVSAFVTVSIVHLKALFHKLYCTIRIVAPCMYCNTSCTLLLEAAISLQLDS